MSRSLQVAKQMVMPLPMEEIDKLQDELIKCLSEMKELQFQKSVKMKAYGEVISAKGVRIMEIAEVLREQRGVDVSIEQLIQQIDAQEAKSRNKGNDDGGEGSGDDSQHE